MPPDATDERPLTTAPPTPAPEPEAGYPTWAVVVVVAAGVALRLAVLLTPLGRADADEVIAGLMARHLGDDGYPPFFWGQHYGGTLELAPVWVSLKVFGWSVGALRVPTLVLGALNTVLVWRVGRRWLPEHQARLAALLLWVGPPAFVWFGVREQLFYTPTITLGLLLGVVAYRIREDGRTTSWAAAGLLAGLGVWTSTTIVYFAVPAVAIALGGHRPIAGRTRELARGVPVAAAAFVVGALPLLDAVVRTGGAPLRAAEDFPVLGTYATRFAHFFGEALPGALGFRSVYVHTWFGGALGIAAYGAVLAVLGWSLWRSWPWSPQRAVTGWAAIGFVAYPFVYASIPFVTDDPNLRYTALVVPFVALVLARVVPTVRVGAVVLGLTAVVTVVGLVRIHTVSEVEDHGHRLGGAGDLAPAIEVLDREGISAVYGDYWVAYRLAFETEERVIGAPSWGLDRYDPYRDHVRASDRTAWVVERGGQLDALRGALTAMGVGFEEHAAGELAVVVPDRRVDPPEVPEAARWPVRGP